MSGTRGLGVQRYVKHEIRSVVRGRQSSYHIGLTDYTIILGYEF